MCLKRPPVPQLVQNYPPLFNSAFLIVFTKASDWTPLCKYVWSISINFFLYKEIHIYISYTKLSCVSVFSFLLWVEENTRGGITKCSPRFFEHEK